MWGNLISAEYIYIYIYMFLFLLHYVFFNVFKLIRSYFYEFGMPKRLFELIAKR